MPTLLHAQALPNRCQNVIFMGGLIMIRACFADDILAVERNLDGVTYDSITLKNGAAWQLLGFESETANLAIVEQENEHGLYYVPTVKFTRLKDDKEVWYWLRRHRNRGLVLETTDLLGTLHMVGSKYQPVYRRFGYDGKTNFGEAQGFEINISGKQNDPPLIGGEGIVNITPSVGGSEMVWTERIRVAYDGQTFFELPEPGKLLTLHFKAMLIDLELETALPSGYQNAQTVISSFTYTGFDYPKAGDIFVALLKTDS